MILLRTLLSGVFRHSASLHSQKLSWGTKTLKIIVPIKQVPEITEVKIDPETKTLVRAGVPSILNPFDEFAIEEAVRIKEKLDGEVQCIAEQRRQLECEQSSLEKRLA